MSKSSLATVYRYIGLSFCFIFHLWLSGVGWNNSLLDGNDFRQTQTAHVARSFAEVGPRLDYEIPVFADHSRIPFEFPTFQFIVAQVHHVTGFPLESAGRLTSLLFYFATLLPLYSLVFGITRSQFSAQLALVFMLVSPLYIYWSRNFLIESTALFFSISFLGAIFHFLERHHFGWLVLATFCGVIGGLTKITTLAVALAAASGLFINWWWKARKDHDKKVPQWITFGFCICVALCVAGAVLWTNYTDKVKLESPMGATLTSSALSSWNFGTLKQRFDIEAWTHVGYYSFPQILGTFGNLGRISLVLISLFILFLFARADNRIRYFVLLFFGTFCIGPIVFWNLYQQHSYYWYANGAYFLIGLAIVIGSFSINQRAPWIRYAAVPILVIQMLVGYFGLMFKGQRDGQYHEVLEIAKVLESKVKPDELILIFGDGYWNPRLSFYSRRRALMYSCTDEAFRETFSRTDPDRFGALICFPGFDRETVEEKCTVPLSGIESGPSVSIQGIDIYFRKS